MSFSSWLFKDILTKLEELEGKMDQERMALDALTAALGTHFDTVNAACAKIIELINAQPPPADPDVDNSAEIAALAGQIQASTDSIKAVLP